MNIKYYFYTRKMLSNYLEISEELLNVIGVYCHRDINISKKLTKYTNLNIYLNGSTLNDNNDFFRSLAYQLKYIYNINQVNVNDQDQKLKLEFEDYMKYCHQQIECKLENITSIDHGKLKDEIVQSFMTGKLYSELLSVILFNYFQLYQYFENIEENCCYNVTTHLRKSLYKLLLIRNYHDGYKTENNDMCCSNVKSFCITEYQRKEMKYESIVVKIDVDMNRSLPDNIDERLNMYLDIFKSNNETIKSLPYYLIPVVASLRYYLIGKIEANLFDNTLMSDDYNHLCQNINLTEKNITCDNDSNLVSKITVKDYVYKALVSSCVAAMTFTYLHKNFYYLMKNKKFEYNSFEENIKKNSFICKTLPDFIHYNKNRSLRLKGEWSINLFQKFKEQSENAIQIFSEIKSIFYINSCILQALKFPNDCVELETLSSMYHYIWEDAFYGLIYPFSQGETNLSLIFKRRFELECTNYIFNMNSNYFKYLEDTYQKIYHAIIS